MNNRDSYRLEKVLSTYCLSKQNYRDTAMSRPIVTPLLLHVHDSNSRAKLNNISIILVWLFPFRTKLLRDPSGSLTCSVYRTVTRDLGVKSHPKDS